MTNLRDIMNVWASETKLPIVIKEEHREVTIFCVVHIDGVKREIREATVLDQELYIWLNRKNCEDLGIKWPEDRDKAEVVFRSVHAADPNIFEFLESVIRSDIRVR